MKRSFLRRDPIPEPPIVSSGPVVVAAFSGALPPGEYAERVCIHCAAALKIVGDSVTCAKCGKDSAVSICPHAAPRPAWRIVRWRGARVLKRNEVVSGDVVAVTVGDHTVYLGRFRDALSLRAEDGARLPLRQVNAIEPGAEIIERMTHIGSCWRCAVAFFLPDCEIGSRGVPRILRVPVGAPTRQYVSPAPDPAIVVSTYREAIAEGE